MSVPAHEIEDLVSMRLRSFLGSADDFTEAFARPSELETDTRALMAAAKRRSDAWADASPADTRQFLRAIVLRIVVSDQSVEVFVSKQALREALLDANAESEAATDSRSRHGCDSEEDVFRLSIEARLKRYGREVRIVVPAGCEEDAPARSPVPALVKTIARAHSWYERMLSGEIKNQRLLAKEVGLEECHVSRVLQCAFLAPDIVEAILEGRQPADLTLEKLLDGQPMDWAEQRRRLGFSTDHLKNASLS